ncbi:MAG: VacJ family lipoprotein [Deltaproteobacteria bacterium]|nr:VacJ family lipoprotein [Deltaproteobacteria bacterium]
MARWRIHILFLMGGMIGFLTLCRWASASPPSPYDHSFQFQEHHAQAHELERHKVTVASRNDTDAEDAPVELNEAAEPVGMEEDADGWAEGLVTIPDPLEPVNRVFFQFNDKLYFWVLKPVGQGYGYVVPQTARVCIRNFFSNLIMPIRAVSCLLQGKIEGLGIEVLRFVVNTTAGFAGFQDVAKQQLDLPLQDEDLGQVLAFYGIGPGFYIDLPFLGPSSLRATVGWVGQLYLNPLDYLVEDWWSNIGVRSCDLVNRTSLRIGEYESLKDAALDPYVALRDAYYQYRISQIEK